VTRNLMLILLAMLTLSGCASSSKEKPQTNESRIAELNVQLGIGYMQEDALQIANDKFLKALRADPESAEAHWGYALLQMRLGNSQLAEEHFQKALKLDPEDSMAHNNYAIMLCDEGRYRESEAQFMKAVANPLYKQPESAYTNAGICLLKIPDVPGAEEYFRLALEKNALWGPALYQMAKLTHAQGHDLQSRAFMQRYEQSWEHSSESLLLGYQIEKALGNTEGAVQYSGTLKERFPDSRETTVILESEKP